MNVRADGASGSAAAKFGRRLVTSTVLIGLTAYVLLELPPIFFAVQVALFVGLALFEFLALLRQGGIPVYRVFGMSMGLLIPAIVYMEYGGTQSGEILFLVLGCLFLFVMEFFRKDNPQSLIGISLTLFGILYVSWFLSFLIKIRFLYGGAIWCGYLLIVTKACDIGAYSVGTLFGRNTLVPHVSPRKTLEGLAGGIALSVLSSVALGPYLPRPLALPHLIVLGALIAVVGQIGDLSESLMKRFCQARDSGRFLPGMGGFLDAVDSVLFTAPIFYFHLKVLYP
ncbi:MAG: hypothetical protein MOGMAGMI_01154 [Candidatus Omnitrophica bacterium]|nr:hypothetical protein [Candidatus Omnitrophota bacterium]